MKFYAIIGAVGITLVFFPTIFGMTQESKGIVKPGLEKTDKDKAVEEKKGVQKPIWQQRVEQSKEDRLSGRKNGVLIRVEVDLKKTDKGGIVLIHWMLDYDGPRPPLRNCQKLTCPFLIMLV